MRQRKSTVAAMIIVIWHSEGSLAKLLSSSVSLCCRQNWRALRDDFRTLVFLHLEETTSELCQCPKWQLVRVSKLRDEEITPLGESDAEAALVP